MHKTTIYLIIGIMLLLVISGCTRGTNIQPNAQYPSPQPSQGYVGGGCNVVGIDGQETKQLPLVSNL